MPALFLQRSLSCALQAPHVLSTRDLACALPATLTVLRFKHLMCSRRETMPALCLQRSLSCALHAPHVLSTRDHACALPATLTVLRASSTSRTLDERPCLRSSCNAHCLARFKHLMYSRRETLASLFLQRSLSCSPQAPHVLSTSDHACTLPATLTVLRASSTTRDHACALPATLTVLRASSTSCTFDERPCLRSSCNAALDERPRLSSSCNAHCLARFRHQ